MSEPPTGVGRMASTLMRELVALGHEVIPIDWRPNPLAQRLAGRCVVVPPRLPIAVTALWHLELLRRVPSLGIQHDVLLDPTGYPNALGHHPALACVVHDLHMLRPGFYRRFKRTWFRAWLGRGLRKARLIICPSEHTRHELLRRYAIAPERCVVVHNSLDPTFTSDANPTSPGPRDAAAAPYFLVVGTIESRKNAQRLVEAFAACRSRGLAERLVFAGRPGHGIDQLIQRIEAADMRHAVEIRASVDDDELRTLYRGATALLFPSLDEGFGLPILEAMHAGTPVLTSNTAAMPEVAGDAALLVDPLDTSSIRDGIERLGRDQALRAELRQRGARRVQAFSPPSQARAYAAALEEIDC